MMTGRRDWTLLLFSAGLLSCADNTTPGSPRSAHLASYEDRAIGPVLEQLAERREETVRGDLWFVEGRLTVESEDGPVLNRPETYNPAEFSEHVREVVSSHGYEFCQVGTDLVCPNVWGNQATLISIGASAEEHPRCPVPIWVSEVTLNPEEPMPEFAYHAWAALVCLAESDSDELVVTDVRPVLLEH